MKLPKFVLTVLTALVLTPAALAMSPKKAIRHVFGHNVVARCIAKHESHNRARATHINSDGSIDRGLYQINSVWMGKVVRYHGRVKYIQRRWILDPLYNAQVAWIISRGGSDWSSWATAGVC